VATICNGCIKECLNRKHSCPCCNHETVTNQLVKNHHYDRLVSIVNQEKEEASRKYFEQLIERPIKNNSSQNKNDGMDAAFRETKLSPIEELFHKHMKKSLIAYEEYYKDLKKKHDADGDKIKSHYVNKLQTSGKFSVGDLESIVKAEYDQKMKEMHDSFTESIQLLLEAYEKYLANVMPVPSFLPISINIAVQSKNIIFRKIVVKPTDNLVDLKTMIEKKFEESGNPIVKFTDVQFVLSGSKNAESAVVMSDEFRPMIQYGITQGDHILVAGNIQLKSELPQECFSITFEKGKDIVMDYYSCRECKINWVCKPCMEICHKGHHVAEYILNHHPTWACCYCVKNRKCLICNVVKQKNLL